MEYESIYIDMVKHNYSFDNIRLFFLIKYNIDIQDSKYQFSKIRLGQSEFRKGLIERFGPKCIITNSEIFEACHIIPFADSNNMFIDNGLLLNSQHHIMFDKYIWSINPDTLDIEINYSKIDENDKFIQLINNKNLSKLKEYPLTIKYLSKHYKTFRKILN